MLQLNTIKAHPGARKKKKRLGRGPGSGHGQTAGKGDKGQLARTGGSVGPHFEGGQTPLYRRIPKKGFKNFFRPENAVLNVRDLQKFDSKSCPEISLEALKSLGEVWGTAERLVILGTGDLSQKIKVKAHKVSPSAKEKIEKAGGSVEVLPPPSRYIREARSKSKSTKGK